MRSWFTHTTQRKFSKGAVGALKFPIRKIPIASDGLELLMIGRNDLEAPAPTMPGDAGFDSELAEVLRVHDSVQRGEWPSWFLEDHGIRPIPAAPFRLGIDGVSLHVDDPGSAADIVRMDDPGDLGRLLRQWLTDVKQPHRSEDGTGNGNFRERIPEFNKSLNIGLDDAINEASQAKSFFGRPRPEEVVCFNCTHYEEGCPKHSSYPAGHGAFAGWTFSFIVYEFQVEKGSALWDELLNACLQFAFFRTFAGVHYANDNAIGFLIGYARAEGLKTVKEAAAHLGWGEAHV